MKPVLLAALAGLARSACADDYYGPYGYGGDYYGGYHHGYGGLGYYDNYYGPLYNGYSGRDGYYSYSPRRGHRWRDHDGR
jgi:hypothetical protein